MSGVEQINNKILQEAQDGAKVKIELAQGRAAKIMEAARLEAGKKKQAMLENAEKKAADIQRRILALADIELRKEKLKVRQELVQAAFDRTREMLCDMSEEEYCDFLASMMVQALQQEEYEIVLSKKDRKRIGARLLAKVLQLSFENGKHAGIRLSDSTADICGGFILRTEEIELNYSFESIMRAEQEQLERLASRKLGLT